MALRAGFFTPVNYWGLSLFERCVTCPLQSFDLVNASILGNNNYLM